MAGTDGFETARALRRWPGNAGLRIIAVSASVFESDHQRAFDAGCNDFLPKPLAEDAMLATLGRALNLDWVTADPVAPTTLRAHLQIRALQRSLEENNTLLQHAIARRLEAEGQLQQSLDRAVLVVRDREKVQFCTRLARRLLERYFPDDPAPERLPAPLTGWMASGKEGPWRTEQEGTRLQVRRFCEPGMEVNECFMLLLEETLCPGVDADAPARLLRLGLTTRETEVLYWIAHGKSNPEIAVILDSAHNTVKKHVANILPKLGVETRLSAALRAVEILGLPGVDAARFRAE